MYSQFHFVENIFFRKSFEGTKQPATAKKKDEQNEPTSEDKMRKEGRAGGFFLPGKESGYVESRVEYIDTCSFCVYPYWTCL
jgi:hypothetical protein